MPRKVKKVDKVNGGDGACPGKEREIAISPPNMEIVRFQIIGTSPLVMHRFSEKAQQQIRDQQRAGSKPKARRQRGEKDFEGLYKEALHVSTKGWYGIPATAFRAGMVSACRVAGYKMTWSKLAIFIEPDGEQKDGTPLVRITKGEPGIFIAAVRNSDGSADQRARGKWKAGWEAEVKVRFDADMLGIQDVANLMDRLGQQVGILEGRADSPKSVGQMWGFFRLGTKEEVRNADKP